METRVWGPISWYMIHGLPWRVDPTLAERFLWSTSNVLPCIHCRQSFRALLRMEPIDARQPITLAEWTWRVHNAVNGKLGKPEYPLSTFLEHPVTDQEWDQAIKNFASFVARNYEPTPAQRQEYADWFKQLGQLAHFPTDGLQAALADRDSLYNWLISTLQIPDDRELIERTRIK